MDELPTLTGDEINSAAHTVDEDELSTSQPGPLALLLLPSRHP